MAPGNFLETLKNIMIVGLKRLSYLAIDATIFAKEPEFMDHTFAGEPAVTLVQRPMKTTWSVAMLAGTI
jgi:hypothetical protein